MKKELRVFLCVALVSVLGFGAIAYAQGQWRTIDVVENGVTVIANDNIVAEPNFLYNDTTYVPLRAVSESLGMDVYFDGTAGTAWINQKSSFKLNKYILTTIGTRKWDMDQLFGNSSLKAWMGEYWYYEAADLGVVYDAVQQSAPSSEAKVTKLLVNSEALFENFNRDMSAVELSNILGNEYSIYPFDEFASGYGITFYYNGYEITTTCDGYGKVFADNLYLISKA